MFLRFFHTDIQAQSFPKILISFFAGIANRSLHSCSTGSSQKRLFRPLPHNVDCPMLPYCATDCCSTRKWNSCSSVTRSLISSLKVMNVSGKKYRILGVDQPKQPSLWSPHQNVPGPNHQKWVTNDQLSRYSKHLQNYCLHFFGQTTMATKLHSWRKTRVKSCLIWFLFIFQRFRRFQNLPLLSLHHRTEESYPTKLNARFLSTQKSMHPFCHWAKFDMNTKVFVACIGSFYNRLCQRTAFLWHI